MNGGLIYKDKPIFGLDIGTSSVKVMQISQSSKKNTVIGYGVNRYEPGAIKDGIIENPEAIAKCIKELFEKNIIGQINTRRVALSVPVAKTYNRVMNLPPMNHTDLIQAVHLEAEQYIPVPIDDLYIDFNITKETKEGIELLAVAAPKQIIDSYMNLADIVGLEPVIIETTINSTSRLISSAEENDIPTILIDFGSVSVDITIIDRQIIVTGTVSGGGDTFTELISQKLDLSYQVAHTIKTKYGLSVSKKQKDIQEALDPILSLLTKEVKKMVRYYEERTGSEKKIGQIITVGGGANMPGLAEHLTNELRLPTRMCNPWSNLDFGRLQPPSDVEKSSFVTAAGLALIKAGEVWK
jgi:type IV pilus assembly protein PilM